MSTSPELTNPEARARERSEKVEYEWATLWPHYHKDQQTWATGIRTKGDVDIVFLSGETGRDPFHDQNPKIAADEVRTKVVGGIKEQTWQCLWAIKGNLEMMGASLKNIVYIRWFVKIEQTCTRCGKSGTDSSPYTSPTY